MAASDTPRTRAQASERSPAARFATLWICLGLVALVVIPYAQVARHEFVDFDDGEYVFANAYVRNGLTWEGVKFAFRGPHASNWHPLTTLFHMLDVELFGAGVADAPGHLLVSVGLHATNSVLLFLVLFRMTGATWAAAFVAALFAVHPLRVESVAWASERKDVLSGLCFLLLLLLWDRYARQPTVGRYTVALVVFALGLLAKPMLVTAPFVLLLLDAWPLGRMGASARAVRDLAREKLPFLALSAASVVLTIGAQQRSLASLERLPLVWRLIQAPIACWTYVAQTVWPDGLACLHPHPASLPGTSLAPSVVLAIGATALLGGVTWLALRRARLRPYLAVGWLWFLGMLVPVIGIVQVGRQAWADRYAYLPTIGLYLMAAWGAAELSRRWRAGAWVFGVAGTVALGALVAVTFGQVGTWRDSRALYEHALRVTGENPAIQSALGAYLMHEGELEEAQAHLEEALRNWPNHVKALTNLGSVFERRGDLAGARERFEYTLRLDPQNAVVHNRLGSLLLRQGDLNGAREHLEEAVSNSPDLAPAVRNLGMVLLRQGDLAGARARLERAIRLAPDDAVAQLNLGLTLSRQGDLAGARTAVARALELRPDYADARKILEELRAR